MLLIITKGEWYRVIQGDNMVYRVRKMFYHSVDDCHWSCYEHNNFLCFG